MDWAKPIARRDDKWHLSLGIWRALYYRFDGRSSWCLGLSKTFSSFVGNSYCLGFRMFYGSAQFSYVYVMVLGRCSYLFCFKYERLLDFVHALTFYIHSLRWFYPFIVATLTLGSSKINQHCWRFHGSGVIAAPQIIGLISFCTGMHHEYFFLGRQCAFVFPIYVRKYRK